MLIPNFQAHLFFKNVQIHQRAKFQILDDPSLYKGRIIGKTYDGKIRFHLDYGGEIDVKMNEISEIQGIPDLGQLLLFVCYNDQFFYDDGYICAA